MVSKIVVGAGFGFKGWLLQRVSAFLILSYIVYAVFMLLCIQPSSHSDWVGFFSGTATKYLTLLAFLATFYHAWVGSKDIIMDYVKPTLIKLSLYIILITIFSFYLIWITDILFFKL